ncbi:Zinc finger DHHC-type palmitoyltransferase [Penicillium chermesinum]|nr:Zinc finger DHHC-type palmitoyltransferase [Penicillium chermesinum]
MATRAQTRTNLVVSRVVPPVLLGIVAYASYAITKPLCIDYLLYPLPSHNIHSRRGAGAAILAVYYVLLIAMVTTYCRLLYTVLRNTGYLPYGQERIDSDQEKLKSSDSRGSRSRRGARTKKRQTEKKPTEEVDLERGVVSNTEDVAVGNSLGLEYFYQKDVYVCQEDGRPPYCSKCCQFKTDRAHHCREVDRCVRKMDHFCPWYGWRSGWETSFKFFIQFVFYTAVFCFFTLIVSAYFLSELRRRSGDVNAHWIVCIVLSGLFGFFSGGMTLSAVQMALFNLTTIESLNKNTHVWILAIRVPEHLLDRLWNLHPIRPLPPERHVFAILHTKPGENPFDLGGMQNMQQIMGYSIAEWLLPLKHSPCTDHSSQESEFPMGPVVARLKQEAGLAPARNGSSSARSAKHRLRRNGHT